MSLPPSHSFPFTHGWAGDARHDAGERFQQALHGHVDLLPTTEVAAEVAREILKAERVSITIIEGETFRDVVNVGSLQADQVRFPVQQIYPMASYPAASGRLLSGRGYISTSKSLDVVQEYLEQAPRPVTGCFMGVPIISGGDVHGELWALRGPKAPVFMPEDLDLVTDFATSFGSRLPALLARQRALYPAW